MANESFKSHYKYLFDFEKIIEPNGTSYAIRLFMPTYELIFAHLINEKYHESDSKSSKMKATEKNESNITENSSSLRLKQLKHTGIKPPTPKLYEDEIKKDINKIIHIDSKVYYITYQQIQKWTSDIKQSLKDIEDDYQVMLEEMQTDEYYEDTINQMLFLYKLDRAFPCQYFRLIFSTEYSYSKRH